jgi:multicomponent Na+:H+ antiporter subunit G
VTAIEWVQTVLLAAGTGFYLVGTIAVLRFPDVYTRVHAITKADNLGLGLLVLGLIPSAGSIATALELLLIWLLVLAASATSGHLVARRARANGTPVWRDPPAAEPPR